MLYGEIFSFGCLLVTFTALLGSGWRRRTAVAPSGASR
jgi:hypothetical protein